jgi:hypothetical protein
MCFLGYSSTYKGYKFSSDGRIYVSKDVLFNEQIFPHISLFSTTKVSLDISFLHHQNWYYYSSISIHYITISAIPT